MAEEGEPVPLARSSFSQSSTTGCDAGLESKTCSVALSRVGRVASPLVTSLPDAAPLVSTTDFRKSMAVDCGASTSILK